ncbi:PI-PLC X domain-containing protein 3 [Armadillidium vulgare]|nr:PI-PLC X domain-containing protein 3 [Armadillidium vulgare]
MEISSKENETFHNHKRKTDDPQYEDLLKDLESWMTNLPLSLRNIPLHHLYIPGSHDSFSYDLQKNAVGPDAPFYVSCLSPIPCYIKNVFLRWFTTQNTSVYEQLMHGIRYFDIRVAVKNKKFYFVHALLGSQLPPLLMEMRKFLDDHRGEVVLLDFQHLFGFDSAIHLLFMNIIKDIFSGIICPFYEDVNSLTLSFLLEHKYQVIIVYRPTTAPCLPEFWPSSSLPNPWPNTVDIPYMVSFLNEKINARNRNIFFVSQCVLTPTLGYIVKNVTSSLERKLCRPCNNAVGSWVTSLSDTFSPNIIMTDFVDQDNWEIPKAIVHCNYKLMENEC